MLPYSSFEEAEASLGRSLSFGEKVWLKYSANKSDFILHCHNILFLCFFYSLATLPYVFVELISTHKKRGFHKYKIQPKAFKTLYDMFCCYKNVMFTFVLAVGPLQILSYPTIKLLGIRTDLSLPWIWELLVQLSAYLIIENFTNYWIHRLLHSPWAYEKIHKVHHEYKSPMALSAPYAHWAEILLLGFPAFLGPTLIPCHILTYWLWFVLRHNSKPSTLIAGMNFHGVPQNTYHFMEVLLTMTTITLLVKIVKATLPPYLPTAILFTALKSVCLVGIYQYKMQVLKKASLDYTNSTENNKVD